MFSRPPLSYTVRGWQITKQAARIALRNLQKCRECREQARFFDDYCDRCGAFSPVRIPYAYSIVVGMASLAAVLLISAF